MLNFGFFGISIVVPTGMSASIHLGIICLYLYGSSVKQKSNSYKIAFNSDNSVLLFINTIINAEHTFNQQSLEDSSCASESIFLYAVVTSKWHLSGTEF